MPYPRCIAGAGSGPPGDIGGVPGYAFLLKSLADSRHPMHGEMLELCGPFDPEASSVKSINAVYGRCTNASTRVRLSGPAGLGESGQEPAEVGRPSGMVMRWLFPARAREDSRQCLEVELAGETGSSIVCNPQTDWSERFADGRTFHPSRPCDRTVSAFMQSGRVIRKAGRKARDSR